MTSIRRRSIFLVPALAVCLAACGGDDGNSADSDPLFTTDELDDLVLLKEDLGDEYQRLSFDAEASGAIPESELMQFVLDEQTKAVFERLIAKGGRINGYAQAYNYPQVESSGPVYFLSLVDLFDADDSASAFIADLEANPTRAQTNDLGDEFSDFTRFRVDGVGDEAFGETGSVEYDIGQGATSTRVTVYSTRVVFQRGPLTALVSVDRADQDDIKAHVTELARMLDDKLETALSTARN